MENILYFRTKISDIYLIYINDIYRRYISSQPWYKSAIAAAECPKMDTWLQQITESYTVFLVMHHQVS